MSIIHEGIQCAPTNLRRSLLPTACRDVPVDSPQVPSYSARYQAFGTNLPTDLAPRRVPPDFYERLTSAKLALDPLESIPTELGSCMPDALERIRTEFESYMKARGARAREEIFQRLVLADPSTLLAVGLEQYATLGNGDRLVLTADLLTSAGSRAYKALKHLTRSYRPELIYFVHGIATSPELTIAEKKCLMLQIAQNAKSDVELLECLESCLEWFSADVRHQMLEAISSSGTFGRPA